MNDLEKWLLENPTFTIKDDEKEEKKTIVSKKNSIPEIDLHGLTLDKALAKLFIFFKNLPPGTLKVRIIHGKGRHSIDNQSVLQKECRRWLLKRKEKKEWVKDFSYAPPHEGGEGATIVWLL